MLVGSGAGVAPVVAGELAYGVGYAAARDSNLAHVPENPVAEQTHVLVGGFFYQEDTIDLKARVLVQAEERHYARETFVDDSGVFVDGTAVWTISPRQFTWTVDDIYRETRVDLTTPDTPANRTDTNSLRTGPDLTLRLNTSSSLGLGGRYGQFDIKGPGDNQRVSGYAQLAHQFSAATTFSLRYETMNADYEPPALFAKVRRKDLFAHYETRATPTDVAMIDLGATRFSPEGGEKIHGRLAKASIARLLTPDSTLRASLADRLSDTFSDLLGRSEISAFVVPTATADVYRNKSADLSYAVQGARIGYSVLGFAQRIDYENLGQDFDERGGRLAWDWRPSVDLRFDAATTYVKRTFQSVDRTDVERDHAISIAYLLTRNWSAAVEGAYTEAESTVPLGNFVNRRVALKLAYSSGPLYSPKSRR